MSHRLFRVRDGWLRCDAQTKHKLPVLGFAEEEFEKHYMNRGGVPVSFFRLIWPGEVGRHARLDDSLPASIVRHWPNPPKADPKDGRWTMDQVLSAGALPDPLPESVAMHLAIHRERYKVSVPVAGLPAEVVDRVFGARFEVDANYQGAIGLLASLAETYWGHPMFDGFDTIVRDNFLEPSIAATRQFFYAVGDCLHLPPASKTPREPMKVGVTYTTADLQKGWSADERFSFWWDRFACYLWWQGRTGGACPPGFARLDYTDRRGREGMRPESRAELEALFPGLTARLTAYQTGQRPADPRYRHEAGADWKAQSDSGTGTLPE
jgi:hypothetical protein